MKNGMMSIYSGLTALALTMCLTPAGAGAQRLAAAKSTPETKAAATAANPDPAAAPTPRMTNGHPNLSGVWYHREPGPPVEIRKDGSIAYEFPGIEKDPSAKVEVGNDHPSPTKNNMPAYKPEYLPKIEELKVDLAKTDPAWSCAPPGVPRIGAPHQIVQGTNDIVFLYADLNGSFYRTVAIDGRPKASVHRIDRSFLGDSYGHWEGDTLVVEVDNMNDDTWLADNGLIHSKNLQVTERFTRKGNTLLYEATATDPIMLTKPWVLPARTLTISDEPVYEAPPCIESDGEHIVGTKGAHDNIR
jgi:hypothetical protein